VRYDFIVEGYTEADCLSQFIKRWLDTRLIRPVGIKFANEKGHGSLLNKITKKALAKLSAPGNDEIVGVIGLLDLYGPDFYPAHFTSAEDRYSWAKKEIENQVNDPRFRMFFAVHEVEAWLLSQPDIFPRGVQDIFPAWIASPEKVNFNQPPAKLLDGLYKRATRKGYKKTTYGTQLFERLDPNVAVAKCPYFSEMMSELLTMAKRAGA
jgi:hypothetical protein